MQVFPLIMLALTALTVGNGPVVLMEEGLKCSKIHSEKIVLSEEVLFGTNPFDGAGNHYTIESVEGAFGSASIIVKHTESGGEHGFAMLNAPPGYYMTFEALTFDATGNMIVAVLSGREGGFSEARDYYLIEGLPKPRYWMPVLAAGTAFLVLVLVAVFVRALTARVGLSRRAS